MKNIQIIKYSILLLTGIIILLNVLSARFFVRLDVTEDNRYTLSDATKNILNDLQEPVTIKAYFSEEVPPRLEQVKKEFTDLLVEYSRRSNGMVMYEFINPSESEEIANEAQQAGIPPLQVQVRNNDKFEAMVVYLGAVIQMGEANPEVIPQILENMPMEYHLTTAIKKLSVVDKPAIAILQGHGEPGPQSFEQARQQLDVLYRTDFVELTDTTNVLAPYKTLAIVAPSDSIPPSHLQQIEQFISQGNNLLVALNRVDANLQNGMGSALTTGLETWLNQKGIQIENAFLTDANCANVSVMQNMGGFRVQQQIPFPYLPIIKNFNTEHPVSKGLEEVVLSFASPINFSADSALRVTELAWSSESSGSASVPTFFNPQRNWSDSDFPRSRLPVGAAIEANPVNGSAYRMVVFSDGDFAVNTSMQGGGQINPDNVSLFTNSIDWLSDETGLINLRTKEVTSRPIKDMEDGKKAFLKWLNFLLPIILIIVIGLIRWQQQNLRKIRRMQTDYVK